MIGVEGRSLSMTCGRMVRSSDQLVIRMDANNDVQRSPLKSRLEKLGLVESITSRHGLNRPPTYNRCSAQLMGCLFHGC